VQNTLQALWKWFGPHPIFLGIDEALKCMDGTEDDKLEHLLTASGMFLDTGRDKPSCCVVMSSLSPNKLLPATIASSRAIENILVFPVDQRAGVLMLRSMLSRFQLTVHDDILIQFEALTVGHPRAIERIGVFLLNRMQHEDPSVLESWENARGKLYIPLVRFLASGTSSALAACPEPDFLEYLISNPPKHYQRNSNYLLGRSAQAVDDLIFTGQVLVTNGLQTFTIAGWWLYLAALDIDQDHIDSLKYPSTSLLCAAYQATKFVPGVKKGKQEGNRKEIQGGDLPASLFECFGIFFVAEAMRRGGNALESVVPHLYNSEPGFCFTRGNIFIEQMSAAEIRFGDNISKAKVLMGRINELKIKCSTASASICVILVLPEGFPSLDAVIVTRDKVVGMQTKSKIDKSTLMGRISRVRFNLMNWKNDDCDLLGSEGLFIYLIGIESAPGDLQLNKNEVLVTAGQLREHFLDVFFRFGLTGGEGKYSRECNS
jgi:hypothetical protein